MTATRKRPTGPSRAVAGVLEQLRSYESRNVTFIAPDGTWPIVWERARGCSVWDLDGERYTDLTAAFGVAATGHANRRVVQAGQKQMSRLLHAMGDVHPHPAKAQLARELSRLTFERWTSKPGKTIFCNSGFEAVEAALKSSLLATAKRRVLAFEGAYHGLGYGALNTTHRAYFRGPFRSQLREFAAFAPFPVSKKELSPALSRCRARLRRGDIGAVLVEPVQARAGVRVPPPEFLQELRVLCDQNQALLIVDEIYTGFGRVGHWFGVEHSRVVPDLICLGKALTGGFPLSACVGKASLMDSAWPLSPGEALHTSTFLGHPVGCAMALAQIAELKARNLFSRSAELGAWLLEELQNIPGSKRVRLEARGLGLLAGLELRRVDGRPAVEETMSVVKGMLRQGFIVLPEGEHGNVLEFSPPLTISRAVLASALDALRKELRRL